MCGIAGFLDLQVSYDTALVAKQMGDAIYRRGPDSEGFWQDANYGINLIHRRLAILDLTAAGHQPMISHCGRYVMVFNGEVYNFILLKQELEAQIGEIEWRGHSDSEVILQGFSIWGIERTIQKCEGMFAIALWDREAQDLYLMRDRIGEKPLYYGYFNGAFGFSSELNALKAHPKFTPEIDRNALGQMMLHNCIPAPLSIYSGINKLQAGHILKLSYNDFKNKTVLISAAYWNLFDVPTANYSGSFEDAVTDLEQLLKDVIKDQMIADVPLGCFLSGGVDSSTIAALMQSQSNQAIKTFSVGFENSAYDEAPYARAVAKHLGTSHTELYVSDKDALNVIPKLATIYDEPFSDSSQIPTYLVCQLAKQNVTVALSGDAGDELFAGYSRYLLAKQVRQKMSKIPNFLRNPLAKLSDLASPQVLSKLNLIYKLPIANFSDKTYKLASLLRSKDFESFYTALTSHWLNYEQLVIGCTNQKDYWHKTHPALDEISTMQYLDILGYLPDDILVKVDRAAMANSLETRVPFLNHRVVEFAQSLPLDFKIKNGVTKSPVREVLYKYVPQGLIDRPKQGFGIPIHQWLRGELSEWAQDLLNPSVMKSQGYFNVELVQQKLKNHLAGRSENGFYLWDVLMFQQWLKTTK